MNIGTPKLGMSKRGKAIVSRESFFVNTGRDQFDLDELTHDTQYIWLLPYNLLKSVTFSSDYLSYGSQLELLAFPNFA